MGWDLALTHYIINFVVIVSEWRAVLFFFCWNGPNVSRPNWLMIYCNDLDNLNYLS